MTEPNDEFDSPWKEIAEQYFAELMEFFFPQAYACLLYTSDAADERSSVDLGGRRIIKKKNTIYKRDVARQLK